MNEKELLQKLKEDAAEIEVPEELHPENMKKKLNKQKEKKRAGIRKQLAAAAALVLCSGVLFTAANINRQIYNTEKTDGLPADQEYNTEKTDGSPADQEESETEEQVKKLGDYTKAENYGDVYDTLEKMYQEDDDSYTVWDAVRDVFFNFSSAEDTSDATATNDMGGAPVTNGMDGEATVESSVEAKEVAGDYSKTNLQTEGVDESDIVKTDGKYIYAIENGKVVITDIQNDALKKVGKIVPSEKISSENIHEMFVDGDRLYLIATMADTALEGNNMAEDIYYDVYYMETDVKTILYTYDITDRSNSKLIGQLKQDGNYRTSRKIGDIIYLFTTYYMELPDGDKKEVIKEENTSSWLPEAGEEVVKCGNIYLPECGEVGQFITSVDVNQPDQVLDSKLVMTYNAEVYVSNEAIYIYGCNWDNRQTYTEIAKFSMKNGKIRAAAAASVNGEITDTFAINEYQGYLRVLTTDWNYSGDRTNLVTVLNEDMESCGRITDIAPGEQIYSARFMGNTGYFVTYRNTDPLYTVDFTDPKNPQIKGELKVTGFSEYLHFWGEDKLLGIGYETDPDTGNQKGLKLSMFDISDPCNVKEEAKYVMKNVYYSPALYEYKAVLVNKEKNLIGFGAEKDGYTDNEGYLVFSYENGEFKNVFTETIAEKDGYYIGDYRGLYVGTRFYLVGAGTIQAYDMEREFKLLAK